MKRKWVYLTGACALLLTFLVSGVPQALVQAQDNGQFWAFLPIAGRADMHQLDDFEDLVPEWTLMFTKEEKDGFFEHLNGIYAGHIRDNTARMVSSPGWRPMNDYKLEVDGRHVEPNRKIFNGLGLAFAGDDTWSGYYALMIASGGKQHSWAIVRFEGTKAHYLTDYRGAPNFMNGWDNWNHFRIERRGDIIRAFCNGKKLPGADVTDSRYGFGRLVGLTITSYEASDGYIEFDNFELTPILAR